MRVAFGIALALLAGTSAAHEFWLQPRAFHVAAGAEAPVAALVGDGADRQRSTMAARRILRLGVVGPDGVERDLQAAYAAGTDTRVRLTAAGAHVLVMASDQGARSVLPGDRFEAYLRDEGLTPAITAREGRRVAPGSEAYGRRAKALVQAGTGGPQRAATTPMGLTLEITPQVSPYATPRPSAVPVLVTYDGRPLAGATVKLADLQRDTVTARAVTDAAGRATFAMPARGAWRLSVVWTKPLPPNAETDFDTVFSSLTFGLP